jgi:hypothetical protein
MLGAWGAALLWSCTSRPVPPPFTPAEIDAALVPVKALKALCYPASAAARASLVAVFDFSLDISATGQVRSVPTNASPAEPELIECLRRGLDAIRFPERGHDRLQLHLEMGPEAATGKTSAAPL